MINTMNNVTQDVLNSIENIEQKNIVIENNEKITSTDRVIIEAIKKVKNPFAMVNVDYVMKDLNVCRGIAYKIFQEKDFPSIKYGKEHKIMFLSYVIWKMNKRGDV